MDRKKAKNIIVDRVSSLPTLPDVIAKLIPIMQDENAHIQDLIDVVSFDPAIATRLIKVANSAYYGFMKKITTIRNAVVVLGFRQVKSLALGISVLDSMNMVGKDVLIDREGFWIHSAGCAMASDALCEYIKNVDRETAFTASLLHDIGKLVLDAVFNDEYKKVMENIGDDRCLFEVEEEVLGFTHAEVAGWLCELWKFPADLTYPIMFHHHPESAVSIWKVISSVVHCADYLSKKAGIGSSSDNKCYLSSTAVDVLSLDDEIIERINNKIGQETEKAKAFFSAIA